MSVSCKQYHWYNSGGVLPKFRINHSKIHINSSTLSPDYLMNILARWSWFWSFGIVIRFRWLERNVQRVVTFGCPGRVFGTISVRSVQSFIQPVQVENRRRSRILAWSSVLMTALHVSSLWANAQFEIVRAPHDEVCSDEYFARTKTLPSPGRVIAVCRPNSGRRPSSSCYK